MTAGSPGPTRAAGRSLVLVVTIAFLAASGCAWAPKGPHPPTGGRPQTKTIDSKAQQHFYDLGLQHYSKENYGAAREAFQEVIELGPNTALGGKAQENIRKIDRILKTVEEIESK